MATNYEKKIAEQVDQAKRSLADVASSIIACTQELSMLDPNEVACLKEKASIAADLVEEIERLSSMGKAAER